MTERASATAPCFPEDAHGALAPLRAGHFWFGHRRRAILAAVEGCLAGREGARVLEVGCGDGDVAADLAGRWWTVGLERRLDDLVATRRRGVLPVVMADGESPLFTRCFDLVGLFDVIEHVRDDVGLLRSAASFTVPGGWVVLTVPADPRLWSRLDRYAGHYRRYTRRALEQSLEQAGLEVRQVLPVFRLLWPLGRVQALLERGREVEDPGREYRVAPLWNRLLVWGLYLEGRLCGRSQWGVGTSWLAVTRTAASGASMQSRRLPARVGGA